jgi:hypothetical protein
MGGKLDTKSIHKRLENMADNAGGQVRWLGWPNRTALQKSSKNAPVYRFLLRAVISNRLDWKK